MIQPCIEAANDRIDAGVFSTPGSNPALAENAARVAMTRPFLLALLYGMERDTKTAQMIQEYADFTPPAEALSANRFTASWPVGVPGIGQPPPPARCNTPAPAQPRLPPPAARLAPPLPAGPPPSAGTAFNRGTPSGYYGQLWDVPGRPGFRTDAAGLLYHSQWFSGEYSCPAGWGPSPLGPPGPAATPPGRPVVRGSTLSVPVASALISTASPFTSPPREPCHHCGLMGHAQYECPRRFFETYASPLPGFLPSGEPDPSAWAHGILSAPARAAMAAYLLQHNVPPHRKFLVTAAHIASGTPPPPPP